MSGIAGTVKQPWAEWELEALKAAWMEGGLAAAQQALPHRSSGSLRGKAELLDVHVQGRKPYQKQPSSEWVDAAIRRAYRTPSPCLKQLSRELDRPVGWLKWRAGALGVRHLVERYNRRWTEVENDILKEGVEAGYAASTLQQQLKMAGFKRSLSAVADQVRNLRLGWNRPWYTASEIGQLLGIESKSVAQWIAKGWLKATRGVGVSSPLRADDLEERRLQYQITVPALRKFLLAHPRAWDHRRVRIEVLLDLLCGGEHGLASGSFGGAGHG